MNQNRIYRKYGIFFLIFLLMLLAFQSAMAYEGGASSGVSGDCKWSVNTSTNVLTIEPNNAGAKECTLATVTDYTWEGYIVNRMAAPWGLYNWVGTVDHNFIGQITGLHIDSQYTVHTGNSAMHLFNTFTACTDWSGLARIDVSGSTDLQFMFSNSSLGAGGSLNYISGWNVSNVQSMRGTFSSCPSLTGLSSISGWSVSNVRNMNQMFSGCTSLTDLSSISRWNVSNVTDMGYMFGTTAISDLNEISQWNVSNVQNIESMFRYCANLKDLTPISGWSVSKVTNMNGTFSNCTALEDLTPISGWAVSNVTNMNSLFSGCTSLSDLTPISSWPISNVTNMSSLFYKCAVEDLTPISGWNVSNVTSMGNMFNSCTALKDQTPIAGWAVKATEMLNMFKGCSNLQKADFTQWDFSAAKTANKLWGFLQGVGGGDVVPAVKMNQYYSAANSKTDMGATKLYILGKRSISEMTHDFSDPNNQTILYFEPCAVSVTSNGNGTYTIDTADNYPDPQAYYEAAARFGDAPTYDASKHYYKGGTNLEFTVTPDDTSYKVRIAAKGETSGMLATEASGKYTLSNLNDNYSVTVTIGIIAKSNTCSWDIDPKTYTLSIYPDDPTATECTLASLSYQEGYTNEHQSAPWGPYNHYQQDGQRLGKITALHIAEDYKVYTGESAANMFFAFNACTDWSGLARLYVTNATKNTRGMFCRSSLTDDGLKLISGWDLSEVTHMRAMFSSCSTLTDLTPLKDWDVSKVTNMGSMFSSGSNLTDLTPLAGWNVTNVTTFEFMFMGCTAVQKADFSGWNFTDKDYVAFLDSVGSGDVIPAVKLSQYYEYMFAEKLYVFGKHSLADFGTGNTDLEESQTTLLFEPCAISMTLSGNAAYTLPADTYSDPQAYYTAVSCFSGAPTYSANKRYYTSGGTVDLKITPAATYGVGAVIVTYETGTSQTLSAVSENLYRINLTGNFSVTVKVVVSGGVSGTCSWSVNTATKVLSIKPNTSGASSCTLADMGSASGKAPWALYNDAAPITGIQIAAGNTVKTAASACGLFANFTACTDWSGLTRMDVSGSTNLSSMFAKSSSLTSLSDLAGWNVSAAANLSSMFTNCSSLTSLSDISGWNIAKATNLSSMFNGCTGLTDLSDLSLWNTAKGTNFSAMFANCSGLTSLNGLAGWNISSATNLSKMFTGCSSVKTLSSLSSWNTGKVTNLSAMFANCSGLTSLNGLADWNVAKAANLNSMFKNSSNLKNLTAIGGWGESLPDTANLGAMFSGCTAVKAADFSGWDFTTCGETNRSAFLNGVDGSGVKLDQYYTNMGGSNLYVLGTHSLADLEKTDLTDSQTTLIFEPCAVSVTVNGTGTYSLTSNTYSDPEAFYTAVAAFKGAPMYSSKKRYYTSGSSSELTITPASGYAVTSVIATDEAGNETSLSQPYSLDALNSNYTLEVTTALSNTFGTCSWSIDTGTQTLSIYPTDPSAADCTLGSMTDASSVPWHEYNEGTKIKSVKIDAGYTVKTADGAANMFADFTSCTDWSGLAQLDVSGTTNMSNMFKGCDSMGDDALTAVSGWNVSAVTNMSNMFNGCSGLADLSGLGSWNVSAVANMSGLFNGCSGLTDLSGLGSWNVSAVANMSDMFYSCRGLTNLRELDGWNVSAVTNMSNMFYNCRELTALRGLEDWNVGAVTDMSSMFSSCVGLEDQSAINSWGETLANPLDANHMFAYCSGLKTADFTDWDFTSTNCADFFLNVSGTGVKLDQYIEDMNAEKLYVLGIHKLSEMSVITGDVEDVLVFEPCAVEMASSGSSTYTYTLLTDSNYSDPEDFYTAVSGFKDAPSYSVTNRYYTPDTVCEFKVTPAADCTLKSVIAVKEDGSTSTMTGTDNKYQLDALSGNVTISVTTATGSADAGDSGSCSWSIDSNNVLTIKPAAAGAMECTLSGTAGSVDNVPWHEYNEGTKIKGVKIADGYTVKTADDASHLFEGLTECTDWSGLENLDVSGTSNLEEMFKNCDKLTNLSSLDGWDVSEVTNMGSMFEDCDGLTSLSGIEDWDVSGVTDLEGMFKDCDNLKDVTDINSWGEKFDDPSHTSAKEMFSGSGIKTADFTDWNIESMGSTNLDGFLEGVSGAGVKLDGYYEDMGAVKLYLPGIHSLDELSPSLPSSQSILVFEPCAIEVPSGGNVDYELTPSTYTDPSPSDFYDAVSGFEDAPKYSDTNRYYSPNDDPVITITPKAGYTLKSVIATDEDGNPVELTSGGSEGTYSLSDIKKNVTLSVTTVTGGASAGDSGSCSWSIDSNNILTITPATAGAAECTLGSTGGNETNVPWYEYNKSTKIKGVKVDEGITVKTADDASHLFENFTDCTDWSGLEQMDVSETTNMDSMFENCDKLKDLSVLEDWDVSGVTSMEEMFHDCDGVTTLNGLEDWDVSNVEDMDSMFESCDTLKDLSGLEDWDVDKVTDLEGMFKDDTALEDVTDLNGWGEKFDDPSHTNAKEMFSGDTGIDTADFSGWDFEEMGGTNREDFLEGVGSDGNVGVKLDSYYEDMGGENLYLLEKHKLSELSGTDLDPASQDILTFEPCAIEVPSGVNVDYVFTPDGTYSDPQTFYTAVDGFEDAPEYSDDYRYFNPDDDPVIKITPKAGYTVKSVIATDEDGNPVTLTPGADDTYSLNNIPENVTLSVTTVKDDGMSGTSGSCSWSIENNILTIKPAAETATECTLSGTVGDASNVPWQDKSASITKVQIADGFTVKTSDDASHLFEGFSVCTDWSGLANLDVSGTTNMDSMFAGSGGLSSLNNLQKWDVSKVTSMESMFKCCTGLTGLSGLKNWNISQVTSMKSMFAADTSLTKLSGLEAWNTSQVTDLSWMFMGCTSLQDVTAVNSWGAKFTDPANTDAAEMFSGCTGMKAADFTGWDFTEMGSTNLENFLDGVNGAGVKLNQYYTNMKAAKLYVLGKHSVDELTGTDLTDSQTTLVFEPCAVKLPSGGNGTYTLTDSTYTNSSDYYTAVAGLEDAPSYDSVNYRYYNPDDDPVLTITPAAGDSIKTVVATGENGTTSTLTADSEGKYPLTDIKGNVTLTVTTITGGTNAGTSGTCKWSIDSSSVLTISPASAGATECTLSSTGGDQTNVPWYDYNKNTKIKGVKAASGITVKTAEDASHLFEDFSECTDWSGLKQLDVSGTTNMDSMFENCDKMTGLSELGSWDVTGVTSMEEMFHDCDGLTTLSGLANWNVTHVTNMDSMFENCDKLETLSGLENWNVTQATDLEGMFKDSTALKDVTDINSWGTKFTDPTHTNAAEMFSGCTGLKTADFTDWDFTKLGSTNRNNFLDSVSNAGVKLDQYYEDMGADKLYVLGKHKLSEITGAGSECQDKLVLEPCAVSGTSSPNSTYTIVTENTYSDPQSFYAAVAGFEDAPAYSTDARYFNSGDSIELTVTPASGYNVKSVVAKNENGTQIVLTESAGKYDVSGITGNVTVSVSSANDNGKSGDSGSCSWSIDSNNILTITPATAGAAECTLGSTGGNETNVPWYEYNQTTKIKGVKVDEEITVKTADDASHLFENFTDCTDWSGLEQMDVSETTNMDSMFENCDKLKDLSVLEDWDVSGVTSMEEMFHDCDGITTLNGLEDWDVSNVEDMDSMFESCDTLKDLSGLEDWDVDKVTDLEGMFKDDTALEDVTDLNGWGEKFDDPSHTNAKEMFSGDTGIDTADFSGWDFEEMGGTNREDFLEGVGSDGNVGVKLDSYYEDMGGENLYLLEKHKLSELSGTDLDPASQDILTFEPCAVEVPSDSGSTYTITPSTYTDPEKFYTAVAGFEDAPSYDSETYRYYNPDDDPVLTITPASGYTIKTVIATDEEGNPTTLTPTGEGTYPLNDIPGNVTISVTTVKDDGKSGISGSCSWSIDSNDVLTISPVSGKECTLSSTGGSEDNVPWHQYNEGTKIKGLKIASGNTVKTADDASHLFEDFTDCTDWSGLENLDVSGTTNMDSMFDNCDKLTDLSVLKNWDVTGVTSMEEMFRDCDGLTTLSGLDKWDVSGTSNMDSMFENCDKLNDLSSLDGWDVSKVTDLEGMFKDDTALKDLTGLNSWGEEFDDPSQTNAAEMFSGCTGVKTADFTDWNFTEMGSTNRNNILDSVSNAGVKLDQYYDDMGADKLYVLGKHKLSEITGAGSECQDKLVFEPCAVKLPSGGNGTYELTDSTYTNPSDYYTAVAGFEDAPSYDSENYRYYNPDDDPVLTITPAAGDSIKTVVATGENGTTSTLTADSEGKYPLTDIKGNVTLTVTTITGGTNAGTSGTCKWSIDSSSVLTISPASAGATECTLSSTGGDQTNVPWYDYNKNTKIKGVKAASGITVKTAEDASHLFEDFTECTDWSGLKQLDVSGTTNMDSMFENCDKMTGLSELGSWDVTGVTSMEEMFHDCDGLTTLSGLANWNVTHVTNMDSMFENCDKLETLSGLENWNVTQATDLEGMFKDSTALKDVTDINSWGTKFTDPTHTNAAEMFSGCTGLKTADFTDWDFTKLGSTNRNNFLDSVSNAGVKLDQYYEDMGADKLYVLGKHKLSEITGAGSECQDKLVLEPCAVSGTSSPNSAYTLITDSTYTNPSAFYDAVAGFEDAPAYSTDVRYFNPGDSCELTVTPAADYKIKSVVSKDEAGTQTALTNTDGKYEVSGITGNVSVTVTTEKGGANTGTFGSCTWSIDASTRVLTLKPADSGAKECTLGSTSGSVSNVPWYEYNESVKIKGLTIASGITVKTAADASHLFDNLSGCTDWSALARLDVSGAANMDQMFNNSGLTDLSSLSGWNVSNVSSMAGMFKGCSGLEDASDINSWGAKLSKTANVSQMFSGCTGLKTADFTDWNFANMTCGEFLKSVSGAGVKLNQYYDTMGAEKLYVQGKHRLAELTATDLSEGQTTLAFEPCTISVKRTGNSTNNLLTANTYDDPQAFYTAVAGFSDASKYSADNRYYTVGSSCELEVLPPNSSYKVKSVVAAGEDGKSVKLSPDANGHYWLKDLKGNSTVTVTTEKDKSSGTSGSCSWAIDIQTQVLTIKPAAAGAAECTLGSTTDANSVPWYAYNSDTPITGVKIDAGCTVKTGTSAAYLFSGLGSCTDWSGLKQLDVSGTSDMQFMFKNCYELKDLSSLSSWDVSNARNLTSMFINCSSLEDLTAVSGWGSKLSDNASAAAMFCGCTGVTTADFSEWDFETLGEAGRNGFLNGVNGAGVKLDQYYTDMGPAMLYVLGKHQLTDLAGKTDLTDGQTTLVFEPCAVEMTNSGNGSYTLVTENTYADPEDFYTAVAGFADAPVYSGNARYYTPGTTCELTVTPAAGDTVKSVFAALEDGTTSTLTPVTEGSYSLSVSGNIALSVTTGSSNAGTSGSCSWSIDSNNILTIKPSSVTAKECTLSGTAGDSSNVPWYEYNQSTKIKGVQIASGYTVKTADDASHLFESLSECTDWSGLKQMDVSGTTNMDHMFDNCDGLTSLSGMLDSWNVSKAASMASMFADCDGLKDLSGLAGWNVAKVTSTESMFAGCDELKDLSGLGNWDVSKVTNMSSMFSGCANLENQTAVNSWGTKVSDAVDAAEMFSGCTGLKTADFTDWDFSALTEANRSGFLSGVGSVNGAGIKLNQYYDNMGADKLYVLGKYKLGDLAATDLSDGQAKLVFEPCVIAVTSGSNSTITLSDSDYSDPENFCTAVAGFEGAPEYSADNRYYNYGSSATLTVTPSADYAVKSVTATDDKGKPMTLTPVSEGTYTLNNLTGSLSVTVSTTANDGKSGDFGTCSWSIDSANVLTITPAASGAKECTLGSTTGAAGNVPWYEYNQSTKIQGVKVASGCTVKTADDASHLFENFSGCTDWSGLAQFDASGTANMESMFAGCSGLKALSGLKSWDVSHVTNMKSMFADCDGLSSLSGLNSWNVSNVKSLESMFSDNDKLSDVSALGSWNVSGATNLSSMFVSCGSLKNVSGLGSWNVANVTTMEGMFKDCSGMTDLSEFNSWGTKVSAAVNAAQLFSGCTAVKTADLTGWDFTSLGSTNRAGFLNGINGAGVKMNQYYTDMGASKLYVLGKHELSDIATDLPADQTVLLFEPCVVAVTSCGNNTYKLNTQNTYPAPEAFYAAVAGFADAPVYSADNRYYTPGNSCSMEFQSPVAGYAIKSVIVTGEDGVPITLLPDENGKYALDAIKGNYTVEVSDVVSDTFGTCIWSINTATQVLTIKPASAGAKECTLGNTEPLAGGVSNAPWATYNNEIAAIKGLNIASSYTVKTADSAAYMFSGLGSCTDWSGLKRLNVSGTTDLSYMFANCGKLKDLSLVSGWNVSHVMDMSSMFLNCKGLKDLSQLNSWGSKAIGASASSMFSGCTGVKTADLSNWDFSKLSETKRSGFLNNVNGAGVRLNQYYAGMGASKLYVLGKHSLDDMETDLTDDQTTLVFEPCTLSVTSSGNFNYKLLTANSYPNPEAFFTAVAGLSDAPAYSADKRYYTVGSDCEFTILPSAAGYSIKSVTVTGDDGKSTALTLSADGHYQLQGLTGNVSISVKTASSSSASGTFGTCLWSIDSNVLSIEPAAGASECTLGSTGLLAGNIPDAPWAAYNNVTAPITAVHIDSGYTVHTADSTSYMFSGLNKCTDWSGLKQLDVSGTANMKSMFSGCSKMQDLSALSGWNVSNVTNMQTMFYKCKGLKDLSGVNKWGSKVSNTTNAAKMFYGCSGVETADLTGWNFTALGETNRSGFLNGVSGAGVKLNQYYANMGAEKLYVLGKHALSEIATDLTDGQTTLVFEPCAVMVSINGISTYNLRTENTYPNPEAFYKAVAGFKNAPVYSENYGYYLPGGNCELEIFLPTSDFTVNSVVAIGEDGTRITLTPSADGHYWLNAISGNYSVEIKIDAPLATVCLDLDFGVDHISPELKVKLANIHVGESFKLPGVNEVTKFGYILDGWDDNGDGIKDYEPGEEYLVMSTYVLLRAIYRDAVGSFTITYEVGDAESGTAPAPQTDILANTTVKLRGNDGGLKKTGYEFYCWTDGEKWYMPHAEFVMPDEDVTLWAVFAQVINRDPLPEDEIGTYGYNEDGTKFYIQFHNYDICMSYMGDENLCRNTSANLYN